MKSFLKYAPDPPPKFCVFEIYVFFAKCFSVSSSSQVYYYSQEKTEGFVHGDWLKICSEKLLRNKPLFELRTAQTRIKSPPTAS